MVLLRSLAGAAKVAKTFGGSPAVAQIDERVSLPANIGGVSARVAGFGDLIDPLDNLNSTF
tara:strand:- start:8313 stop:8495 length:183 start_codon:yes stop_codon:yes gene_type:complete